MNKLTYYIYVLGPIQGFRYWRALRAAEGLVTRYMEMMREFDRRLEKSQDGASRCDVRALRGLFQAGVNRVGAHCCTSNEEMMEELEKLKYENENCV